MPPDGCWTTTLNFPFPAGMRASPLVVDSGCLVGGDAQAYFAPSCPSRASWRVAACPLIYSALASRLRPSARTAPLSPDGGEGSTEEGCRLCEESGIRIVAGRPSKDGRAGSSKGDLRDGLLQPRGPVEGRRQVRHQEGGRRRARGGGRARLQGQLQASGRRRDVQGALDTSRR